jgi:hypothetical protein
MVTGIHVVYGTVLFHKFFFKNNIFLKKDHFTRNNTSNT